MRRQLIYEVLLTESREYLEGPGDMTLMGRRRLHESMKHLPHLHEWSLDLSLGSATYS